MRDQSVAPSMGTLMIRGVSASAVGSVSTAVLKWSLSTCAAAPSSWNASTRTNSFGSSVLRDHSNHRFPGSARVASVNSWTKSSHRSDHSGFVLNLATMRITSWTLRAVAREMVLVGGDVADAGGLMLHPPGTEAAAAVHASREADSW